MLNETITIDGEEALNFTGPTAVGGLFESQPNTSASAAHFSGFIARKLMKEHLKKIKCSLSECAICSYILSSVDYNIHLFTTFKEFSDSSSKLLYCSQDFIDIIMKCERIFLFCFHNHGHCRGFVKLVVKAIKDNCELPFFCSSQLEEFFVRSYVKCRTHQSCKLWSNKLIRIKNENKLKKLKHE